MSASVFKFMSGEQYHLDSLANSQVYFSSVDELNDPYEGLIHFCTKGVTDGQRAAALTQRFKKEHSNIKGARKEVEALLRKNGRTEFNARLDKLCKEEFEEFLQYHRQHRFVLSLSKAFTQQDPFPSPLNSMMMWGHYADGMRGMCVEYDYDLLRKSINKLNSTSVTSRVITYNKTDLPIVRARTLFDDIAMDTRQTSTEILNAFCTKNYAWNYENEIRLISEKSGLNDIDILAVKRVFVSSKNLALMGKVKKILKTIGHKPELYEVVVHPKEYGVGFGKESY